MESMKMGLLCTWLLAMLLASSSSSCADAAKVVVAGEPDPDRRGRMVVAGEPGPDVTHHEVVAGEPDPDRRARRMVVAGEPDPDAAAVQPAGQSCNIRFKVWNGICVKKSMCNKACIGDGYDSGYCIPLVTCICCRHNSDQLPVLN